jgi:hypothetical protein
MWELPCILISMSKEQRKRTLHQITRYTDVMSIGKSTEYHTPSGAPEFTPNFSGVRVARSLVFCVMFCRLLFVFVSPFSF